MNSPTRYKFATHLAQSHLGVTSVWCVDKKLLKLNANFVISTRAQDRKNKRW